jgi:hypothetical protein
LAQLPQVLGVIGLLAVALLALYKRMVVMGWQFTAVERDRDFWRDMALRLLKVNEKTLPDAEKADGA